MRTRVKICGITREQDAQLAVSVGADAIGLVFYPPSPRAVTVAQAAKIVRSLPPFVTVTALFVNAQESEVQTVLEGVDIDLLQFHGDESAENCSRYGVRYMKAIRMSEGLDLAAQVDQFSGAAGLLVDTFVANVAGGTGQSFDWRRVPQSLADSLVIAGGLDADNVGELIRILHPYAVDVSGGVEASKGIKDAAKLNQFFAAVTAADQAVQE